VLVVLAIVAVSLATLAVSWARNRELSRRAVCKKNLSRICTALFTYADDNSDFYPIPHHPAATDDRVGLIDYTQAIGSYRGRADDPNAGNPALVSPAPTKLSTTRGLWMLFRGKLVTRDQFVCPSTQDRPNDEARPEAYWDFGVGDIAGPATPEQVRQGYRQVSYGYQVPYGELGQPRTDVWLIASVADKGAFGAAIEDGAPPPPPFPATLPDSPAAWRPWNSPNHGGHGRGEIQQVLEFEGSVYSSDTPLRGLTDNAYTQQGGRWTGKLRTGFGNPPTPGGRQTPARHTTTPLQTCNDTLIYP